MGDNKKGIVTIITALIVAVTAVACVMILTNGIVGYKKSA